MKKLKSTTFLAFHADGLVETSGHEFEVNGRKLVVHKARPQLQAIDKNYKVSEATVGFGVPIPDTTHRVDAVQFGTEEVNKIDEESWQRLIKHFEELCKALPIVRG